MRNMLLIGCVVFVLCGSALGFSGRGVGSMRKPYVVTNVKQLQEMGEELDGHYVLGKNIDAGETSKWNDGAGFLPVGSWADGGTKKFVGTLCIQTMINSVLPIRTSLRFRFMARIILRAQVAGRIPLSRPGSIFPCSFPSFSRA